MRRLANLKGAVAWMELDWTEEGGDKLMVVFNCREGSRGVYGRAPEDCCPDECDEWEWEGFEFNGTEIDEDMLKSLLLFHEGEKVSEDWENWLIGNVKEALDFWGV